ncbi:hypothetical protein [Prescottella subtropica]|uniref:hypothetical protein n=1 Tax=Prescottella subtropica TaxID=2545757 RepID=UPI0010F973F3|nr:hypothetical protein [Prescottella subtropica]
MLRIDDAVEERERDDAAARARELEAQQQAVLAEQRWREKIEQIQDRYNRMWDASVLREITDERWTEIPSVLSAPGSYPHGIHAAPVHWHLALYESLIHHNVPGYTFTVNDCWVALLQQGIRTNQDPAKRFRSLIEFLEALQRARLLERAAKYQWCVL